LPADSERSFRAERGIDAIAIRGRAGGRDCASSIAGKRSRWATSGARAVAIGATSAAGVGPAAPSKRTCTAGPTGRRRASTIPIQTMHLGAARR